MSFGVVRCHIAVHAAEGRYTEKFPPCRGITSPKFTKRVECPAGPRRDVTAFIYAPLAALVPSSSLASPRGFAARVPAIE